MQIIPGVCHDNVQISCLDCASDTGKIAAAYDDQVIIFEPTPLVTADKSSAKIGLNYWWVETGRIRTDCKISSMAWNNDASRFLTAGEFLQLWQYEMPSEEARVSFELGQPSSPAEGPKSTSWSCLWKTRPANPIVFLSFSSDGSLFATAGVNDRLVRMATILGYLVIFAFKGFVKNL